MLVSCVGAAIFYAPIAGVPYVLSHEGVLYACLGFVYGWLIRRYSSGLWMTRLWYCVGLIVITLKASIVELTNLYHGLWPSRSLFDSVCGEPDIIFTIGVLVGLSIWIGDLVATRRRGRSR
jgi:hypothetical protein